MDFDFFEAYKDLSTVGLLKIVHRPDGYQAEAVEAARRRLAERDISSEDQAEVQAFYEEADLEVRLKAEKIARIKGQAADLLEPVLQPGETVTPEKWFKIFLIVLGLQYSWVLIQSLISIYKDAVRVYFDFNFLINIITLVYIPWFFYLLYKRRRWGWILVFAGILIGILGVPVQIYAYSSFSRAMGRGSIDAATIAWFVFQTLLRIILATFLWRQDVCDLFGVDKSIKIKTVIYTTAITVLFFGVLWLRY